MTSIVLAAAGRHRLPIWLLGLAAGAVAGAIFIHHPHVLLNTTPSEPPGLYVRSAAPPAVGQLVVFHAPAEAKRYINSAIPSLRHGTVLKAVAAGEGDRVCTTSGRLVINGRDRAAIAQTDHQGRTLPHWVACRVLAPEELFVFSDRVANSFDSRYFGPVRRDQLVGVYRQLSWPREAR